MGVQKVLITGGFGFVGSLIARHLRLKGVEVVVMEHPNAQVPPGLEDVEVLHADITDEQSMASVKASGIDAVLHLAAQSSGPRSFFIPGLDVKLNILGTVNVIDWCIANQVDRILFASSFVIYGDHPDREALDEEIHCKPKSVYAISKLACEHLLLNYAQAKGVRWNSLRMFNVYGPGQDITKPDQGVVGIFMNMLRKQDEVQVKGRLDRFRDLIYIDDVIQGWDRCLFANRYNQAFNLGTGEKTTFDQLIRSIARVMGKEDRLKIVQLDGTPGDMMGCYADLTRITREIGFVPQYRLHQGLEQMWQWVQTNGGV
ncbi:MAG: NAD-dependent epimerase/dehydratase family protein [Magnetococcales bacterium]|nr:NAD-dependent epimerase/dehydratase family protein [Magnetococcales bacterium]